MGSRLLYNNPNRVFFSIHKSRMPLKWAPSAYVARAPKKDFPDTPMLDTMDIKILTILQEDSTLPVAEIGKKVGLSTTPCWRRIQKLEQDGVIQRRVALLNPTKVSAGVTVFVAITNNQHNASWLER